MAKKVLLDILEKTIGKYVLNLDKDSLNVAVWRGRIELHSLPLNCDEVNAELEQFQPPLPFRVQSGQFAQFHVKVPWANLMHKPVIVQAKGLHVELVPCHHPNNNNDDEDGNVDTLEGFEVSTDGGGDDDTDANVESPDVAARTHAIAHADEYRIQANALRNMAQQELKESTSSSSKEQSSASFGSKLMRRILENMQVEITDVHLTLQNNHSSSNGSDDASTTAGIRLASLQLVTTDQNGKPTFVDRTTVHKKPKSGGGGTVKKESFLHKLLQIHGFAIYLDGGSKDVGDGSGVDRAVSSESRSSRKGLAAIREDDNDGGESSEFENVHRKLHDDDRHDYVLPPLSFQAKLRQADDNLCMNHFKYVLDGKLETLNIVLSKQQVGLAHDLARTLFPEAEDEDEEQDAPTPLFPEYRPLVPLGMGRATAAKQWWHYALRCVGRLNGQRLWVEFYQAFLKRKSYIALYKRHKYALKQRPPRPSAADNQGQNTPTRTQRHQQQPTDTPTQRTKASPARQASPNERPSPRQQRVKSPKPKEKVSPKKMATSPIPATKKEQPNHDNGFSWIKPLTPSETDALQRLELDRSISIEGIMTWRNIADAEMEKEKEAHANELVGTLFGTPTKATAGPSASGRGDDVAVSRDQILSEADNVKLTVEELKELEAMTLLGPDDSLSRNGKWHNVQFVLGSLGIHLTFSPHSSPSSHPDSSSLVVLNMGTVKAALQSNANGSYNFECVMNSLLIQDKITKQSLFPTVLKNQAESTERAFSLQLHKTKEGDQTLKVQLCTFEAIASPILLKEFRRFFTIHDSSNMNNNALGSHETAPPRSSIMARVSDTIRASVVSRLSSGDISISSSIQDHDATMTNGVGSLMNDAPNPLFDAWRMRTETRSSWFIELDIQAPILVLPESCTNATAKLLVFDWGHLKFAYGSAGKAADKITEWFKANPKLVTKREIEPLLDSGMLQISSLSFSVGQLSDLRTLMRKHSNLNDVGEQKSTMVEPISVHLELGVEMTSSESFPRICVFAVVPSINLNFSPTQLVDTIHVYKAWNKLCSTGFGGTGRTGGGFYDDRHLDDEISVSSAVSSVASRVLQQVQQKATSSMQTDSLSQLHSRNFAQFFLDVRFQRISVIVGTEGGREGLEAHLVSVCSTASTLSNGLVKGSATMGWFWIVDNFECGIHRDQRLLVHSQLPALSSDVADESSKYSIMSELERRGVFLPSFGRSSDLANIAFVLSSDARIGNKDPFLVDSLSSDDIDSNTLVDAHFSSLFVNWNPKAVKALLDSLGRISDYVTDSISAPRKSHAFTARQKVVLAEQSAAASSGFVLRGKMDGVEVCLRSAQDDLPVFSLAMTSAEISHVAKVNNTFVFRASLGNLSLKTPDMGRTHWRYRTLLGLAPGKVDSLFSICFAEGHTAIRAVMDKSVQYSPDLSTWAMITVSPMQLIYIQAQVLAFHEYLASGILGTLTNKAAKSAAEAAAEIASSSWQRKQFMVHAEAFELVFPEAASRETFFSLKTGALGCELVSLPGLEGDTIHVSLLDVVLSDHFGTKMQEEPIQIDLNVVLPPDSVGSKRDVAFQIDISTPRFCLMRHQYRGLLSMFNHNIGETDLCLRDGYSSDALAVAQDSSSDLIPENTPSISMSHSADSDSEEAGSICVDITIQRLLLKVLGQTHDDSVVSFEATQATLGLTFQPHKFNLKLSLKDLVCTDERSQAVGRMDRSLISQDFGDGVQQSLFAFSCAVAHDKVTNVGLKVGSPRLLFVPDAVGDILRWLRNDDTTSKGRANTDPPFLEDSEFVAVPTTSGEGEGFEIEAQFAPAGQHSMAVVLDTGQCSVVLVDLGGDSHSAKAVAETIVVRGSFRLNGSIRSMDLSGDVVGVEAQTHGDRVEIYTAFGRNTSALQVLDPFNFSLYLSAGQLNSPSRYVDTRIAVLTPIDICCSMRNVALLDAIISSIIRSFELSNGKKTDEPPPLTTKDAHILSSLDDALRKQSTGLGSQASETIKSPSASQGGDVSVSMGLALPKTMFTLKISSGDAKLTIVNDLFGLDDALLQFELMNVVSSTQVLVGEQSKPGMKPFTGFDAKLTCSITAEYFDNVDHGWKNFLLKPWEFSVRAARGPNRKGNTVRPNTSVDVESFPCQLSVSEELMSSLASANRMWSVYSLATSSLLTSVEERNASKSAGLRQSLAASAARSLVTTLPFAIENNSGLDIQFEVHGFHGNLRTCRNGLIEYFRFPPPYSNGSGGKRIYGDRGYMKTVRIRALSEWIEIDDVDSEIGGSWRPHPFQEPLVLFTKVSKDGRTTVVQVSGGVDIHGKTSLPIGVSVSSGAAGVACFSRASTKGTSELSTVDEGAFSRESSKVGLAVGTVSPRQEEWNRTGSSSWEIMISPLVTVEGEEVKFQGVLQFALDCDSLHEHEIDVVCSLLPGNGAPSHPAGFDCLVVRARIVPCLIDQFHPFLDIILEPPGCVVNKLPIPITIRAPIHTYSSQSWIDRSDWTHNLEPDKSVEIYTQNPSFAISVKCSKDPARGTPTGWNRDWIDLPLLSELQFEDPIRCSFPFTSYSGAHNAISGGTEFFVVDGEKTLTSLSTLVAQGKQTSSKEEEDEGIELIAPLSREPGCRRFFVLAGNYAVDHTNEVLFGLVDGNSAYSAPVVVDGETLFGLVEEDSRSWSASSQTKEDTIDTTPLGAFESPHGRCRISLLPASTKQRVQVIHFPADGEHGMRRSQPFRIEDVSIYDGGVSCTRVLWDDGRPSGLFAYRKMINAYQSEIHIVPEFVVFNGSKVFHIRVRQSRGAVSEIGPGKIAPLSNGRLHNPATISLEWPELQGVRSDVINVEKVGLRMALVKTSDGAPAGTLAVQTVVGSHDSRLVVKLGELQQGSTFLTASKARTASDTLLRNDSLRFRVQWSELTLKLNETTTANQTSAQAVSSTAGQQDVCSILLEKLTIDLQRVFKHDDDKEERSQFSVVLQNIRITDDTPNSPTPIVFDSTTKLCFFDLCVRLKGPLTSRIAHVELFDVNLAHANGHSDQITVSTSESFVWELLDLAERIHRASHEFASVDVQLQWDEDNKGYRVKLLHQTESSVSTSEETSKYTPPNVEKLFDIAQARVSPFVIVLSFERNPLKSDSAANSSLMHYISQNLRFRIDRAHLKFAKYEATHIKGPLDRLVEMITAVYLSRLKSKVFTLMSAGRDWKLLGNG